MSATHTPEGVNHGACIAACQRLKEAGLGIVANVASFQVEDRKYREALTYLLGAMDALSGVGHPLAKEVLIARQTIKAAVPGR